MKLRYLPKTLSIVCFLLVWLSGNTQNASTPNADFEISLQKPTAIVETETGHYFIDFGKAYFGTLVIKAKEVQHDTLIFHLGEKLSGKNQIDRNPGGTIRYQAVKMLQTKAGQMESVPLTANTRNTSGQAIILPDSFGVVMPFRYCEIENLQQPVENLEIRQKAFHYRFNEAASSFSSSDSVLDSIWNLCKHTIKATSFAGYYIDGDRERIPYEADAYINQLSHYSVDTVYSLAKRTNEYFIGHPTWPTEWILHTAMMFYNDYLYTGDLSQITRYYDRLKDKTLIELAGSDGLISTRPANLNDDLMTRLGFSNPQSRLKDIVDWPLVERDGYDMKEINTVVNCFYYQNLLIMSKISGAIGNKADSANYAAKAYQAKAVINEKLFDQSKGIYIDGEGSTHSSLHANLFALAFNLVPEQNLESVIEFIKSRGMACSVYGAQYLLEGLFAHNESAYGLKLITDTINSRTWWNMIKAGSTMTLEAWDIKFKPNLDWNHAWGTAPLNIITRNLWGITPETPGFSCAQIKPQLQDLKQSEIKVPTIRGPIKASYKSAGKNQFQYKIELPEQMEAHFVLPGKKSKIRLNGAKVKTNQSFLNLKSGINLIETKN